MVLIEGAVTENNTVMQYEPGQGPGDFRHDFSPLFLDEEDRASVALARRLCHNVTSCLYHFLATGNRNRPVALHTAAVNKSSYCEQNLNGTLTIYTIEIRHLFCW